MSGGKCPGGRCPGGVCPVTPLNTSTLRGSPTTRAAGALKTFRLKGFPEWMRQREKCGGAEIPGTRVDEQNERQVTSR